MIYITGDTHGENDVSKLTSKRFPEQKKLSRDDYVIITGDFGFIWDGGVTQDYWIKWFSKKNYTVLFIDGNHENFDLLNNFPEQDWNGGRVHIISDNIIHLMRGYVFEIDNKKIWTFGGAPSVDIEYRVEGVSWWSEEMPSEEELQRGLNKLDKYNWKVDYIITHTAPQKIITELFSDKESDYLKKNDLTEYLDIILNTCSFNKWFFGHFHRDIETTDGKLIAIYKEIKKIY